MRWMGFPNCVRVSVGTHEENERFLQVLGELHALSHLKGEKLRKGS